ncbi:hypothetical protein GUITHDRAFT_161250 [Guillardia theta CCMP2712]|uniref:MORN repeat-containing protein n=1 Tax=Guillardia theta (strain CCMP2712) TaxID=905079 RepID=L1JWB3_GUITC|nr:hypothetical protein GUITHDRAFT_161250 [Guillardia theta CCMP2712]EKX52662.1 hypothetical protein GUITHDRAFT_161250 [Guillardia theta CCMP2712]|eukprot:XP_005839642.1 hypothetical protein GUITHDRAFT_161250 [Guillardia theta CCMP2712]
MNGLLPTFDERQGGGAGGGGGGGAGGGGRVPSYGTELSDHAMKEGGQESISSPLSRQRVFRVTTLEDQDYDAIPLQRLKNVLGRDSWMKRAAIWIIVAAIILLVLLVTAYLHSNARLHVALEACVQIDNVDTSHNDAVRWLKMEKTAPEVTSSFPTMSHPLPIASRTKVTDNPRNPLMWRKKVPVMPLPSIPNTPSLLRLPVSLATTLYIQRMQESRSFNDDETPGQDKRVNRLKSLRQALPVDLYQSPAVRRVLVDVLRLLRIAHRSGLVTEVPLVKGTGVLAVASLPDGWGSQHKAERKRFISQMNRFVACTRKGAQVPCSSYVDIMRYPQSVSLLYWGSFSLLKFHGQGILYWRNGLVAYNGSWANGTMSGQGMLFDHYGKRIWTGEFRHGRPRGSLGDLWKNYWA